MTAVLPDSSVWLRRSRPEVRVLLAAAVEAGSALITDAIELELMRSARDARELAELAEEYGSLDRVPLNDDLGQRARSVQGRLAERGHHRGPSPVDLLAAAAAELAGAELWHCDRHFELIAEVTGQPVRRVGS